MTETQAAYVEGTSERQPWHCPGCGEVIGFIYRNPRRLVIDTENILFVVRGDAEIRHHCGGCMKWVRRLEVEYHGLLDELKMPQNIIETEELTETNTE